MVDSVFVPVPNGLGRDTRVTDGGVVCAQMHPARPRCGRGTRGRRGYGPPVAEDRQSVGGIVKIEGMDPSDRAGSH